MEYQKGITNLQQLIKNMHPVINEGEYVFATLKNIDHIPRSMTVAEVKEKEGMTIVVTLEDAKKLGLPIGYVAAWITLNVHSALEAVGLTAAFATALGENGISCNVIAGYFHDHIFVDVKDGERAMNVLNRMRE